MAKSKEDREAERLRAIKIIKDSGLSYVKIEEITGISYSTIAGWMLRGKTPPKYTVDHIEDRINAYLYRSTSNADAIRNMQNKELQSIIEEIRDAALEAKGDIAQMPKKYQDIETWLQGTDLLHDSLYIYNPNTRETKLYDDEVEREKDELSDMIPRIPLKNNK